MDEASITKSVLQLIDFSNEFGVTDLLIEEIYALHYDVLRRHEKRFTVFGGFHPDRGQEGLALFKTGIEKYGFRGLKLYPPLGYPIDDRRLDKCYEICNYHKLPVLIHTGYSAPGLRNHYGEPDRVKEVALQYTNCDFILAHAGYKLDNPVISSLLEIENIFADISGIQTFLKRKEYQSIDLLFLDKFNSKIIFGSDWPITNMMKPLKDQIDTLLKVFEICDSATPEKIQNIMYNNACNILGMRQ
jgi:predicted TIM-barrel fold metal-dependent hydrolase